APSSTAGSRSAPGRSGPEPGPTGRTSRPTTPTTRPTRAPASAPPAGSAARPHRCGSASPTAWRSASARRPHPRPTRPPAPPAGLQVELIDPGEGTLPAAGAPDDSRAGATTAEATAASAANAGLAPLGATEIPALSREETERDLLAGAAETRQRAKPYIGPRPAITTRRGWGADERLREKNFAYTKKVKAAFVHHTASGNNYTCSQAPSLIRGFYRYHVVSLGWRDIGYNFLIDKCGRIYEGRAGGVAKAVLGAHTLGFNSNSMGIAVIGS